MGSFAFYLRAGVLRLPAVSEDDVEFVGDQCFVKPNLERFHVGVVDLVTDDGR